MAGMRRRRRLMTGSFPSGSPFTVTIIVTKPIIIERSQHINIHSRIERCDEKIHKMPDLWRKRQNREYASAYEVGTCREPRLRRGRGCGAPAHDPYKDRYLR